MNQMNIDLEGWNLHRATEENRVEIVLSLIARGDDIESKGEVFASPLHNAAENNSLDVARLLIDRGADIEAKDDDIIGTPVGRQQEWDGFRV